MQHQNIVRFFRSFCSKNENRVKLLKPNYYDNGYIVASDGNMLVMMHEPEFDKSDCLDSQLGAWGVLNPLSDYYEGINKPIGILKVSDFEDVFLEIQKLPEYQYKYDSCSSCEGEGKIFCDCCGNHYECRNCDGDGEVVVGKEKNGYFKFPDDHRINVNGVSLSLKVTNKLFENLKIIDAKELEVFERFDGFRIFYRVKETNIYILQMGLLESEFEKTYDINLTSN